MLENVPVLLADEDKLSPMEQSSSSNEDRYIFGFSTEIFKLKVMMIFLFQIIGGEYELFQGGNVRFT